MKLGKLHHVAIICSDYARSKVFYTEVLGLAVLKETFRADRDSYKLDLDIGDGSQIELFSFTEPPARLTRPEARGLRHIAFEVSNIDEYVNYLGSREVFCEPVRVDENTGKRYTFFFDPDALPIEIYES